MSEFQKIFASLSGAVVAHLLLLMAVFFLIGTRDISASLAARNGSPQQPNEVTILMGDLMDRIELEPLEPEPEPPTDEDSPPDPAVPEPPAPAEELRPFINTDLNDPESAAPENARFESDRNTRAASELPPDSNDPTPDLPTTRGDLPLPYFSLENRSFIDGDFDRPSLPGSAAGGANPSPYPASPAERPGDPADLLIGESAPGERGESGELDGERETAVADAPGRFGSGADSTESAEPLPSEAVPADPSTGTVGESVEPVEGVGTPPELETAEMRQRPEERVDEGSDAEALRERSYLLPEGSESPTSMVEGRDRESAFAAALPETEETERGEAADLPMSEEPSAALPGDGREEQAAESASDAAPTGSEASGGGAPADDGLFAPGFSPERIQNTTSGTLTNRGQNAVDAEATPVGRYKAAVQQAISRKWNQYRHQHGEFVSWGVLKLECRVDSRGKVHGLRVIDNQANAIIADFSLRAILDAELPPMPPEVAEELGAGGLQLKYDIIIY